MNLLDQQAEQLRSIEPDRLNGRWDQHNTLTVIEGVMLFLGKPWRMAGTSHILLLGTVRFPGYSAL